MKHAHRGLRLLVADKGEPLCGEDVADMLDTAPTTVERDHDALMRVTGGDVSPAEAIWYLEEGNADEDATMLEELE